MVIVMHTSTTLALIADEIEMVFKEVEDFPGKHSHNIKDYIVKRQLFSSFL